MDWQLIVVILQVALGLGLVIFIHELGHFLAAKWAGVKVERFSVGFPMPKTSPIAIPLLAIVWSLIGLLIPTGISLITFLVRAVLGAVVGLILTILGRWGSVKFYTDKDGTEYVLGFLPLGGYVKMLGQDDADPSSLTNDQLRQDPRSYTAQPVWKRMVIISAGVVMNVVLAFVMFVLAFRFGVDYEPCVIQHVAPGSPAWLAGLRPGDEVLEINGRKDPKFGDLKTASALSGAEETIELRVRRAGQPDFIVHVVARRGKGDLMPMIGVSPMQTTQFWDEDFVLKGFPAAKAQPEFRGGDAIVAVNDQPVGSFAELQTALDRLARETVSITVQRSEAQGEQETLKVSVAPAPARTLGFQMKMGSVVGIQPGSPAERADVRQGDEITHFESQPLGSEIDPLELPKLVFQRAGSTVHVTIQRNGQIMEKELVAGADPSWIGIPISLRQPMAIPGLGIAYEILPVVAYVEPNSPAARAGIQPNDRLSKLKIIDAQDKRSRSEDEIDFEGEDKNSWPIIGGLVMQQEPEAEWELTFSGRDPIRLKTVEQPGRFLPIRGMMMKPLYRTLQTKNVLHALQWGAWETWDKLVQVYLTVRGAATGRISPKAFGGPLTIAVAAGSGAQHGWGEFLTLLGMISANLAVINFFPIPVLDGGHMMFLVWEFVVGKPPSDKVMIISNYVGLLVIAGLMLGVLYLDIVVHRWLG